MKQSLESIILQIRESANSKLFVKRQILKS